MSWKCRFKNSFSLTVRIQIGFHCKGVQYLGFLGLDLHPDVTVFPVFYFGERSVKISKIHRSLLANTCSYHWIYGNLGHPPDHIPTHRGGFWQYLDFEDIANEEVYVTFKYCTSVTMTLLRLASFQSCSVLWLREDSSRAITPMARQGRSSIC